MMRRAILTLCVAGLASIANAAPPTKAETLALAAKGAAICAEAMPNERTADATLKANGFKFADANGPLKAYLGGQNRVVVIITTSSTRATGCMVSAARMTEGEAMQLIQPWLQASAAAPMRGRPDLKHAWSGTFKGGPVEMAIMTNADLTYFRGAAILARAAQ